MASNLYSNLLETFRTGREFLFQNIFVPRCYNKFNFCFKFLMESKNNFINYVRVGSYECAKIIIMCAESFI